MGFPDERGLRDQVAAVEATQDLDLMLADHVPYVPGVNEVLGMLHSIEHLTGYIDPDAARLLVYEADLPTVAAATAATGTWNVPTLVLWQKRIATPEVRGSPVCRPARRCDHSPPSGTG